MIKIAIVEDETEYQRMFEDYIHRYAKEKGIDISIRVFSDGFDISEGYEPVWDAILLDIKMHQQDGMTATRIIRQHDQAIPN